MKQRVKVKGLVRLVLRGPDGKTKVDVTHKNDIVDTGLAFLASRAVGVADAVMSHMAIGSGTTAVVPGDTTLETELGRAALTSAIAAADEITYEAAFAPGVGTGAITEAGILNAGAAGTLLNRLIFAVINKDAADTLEVTWTVGFEDDGV